MNQQIIAATGAPNQAWLQRNCLDRVQGYVCEVTPEIAGRWLSANIGNRSVRRAHVRTLARAMAAGDWKPTHQGVAFSSSGRLLDGQHRLQAIIESKTTVKIAVFVGLPEDVFGALDRGMKRHISDDLQQDRRIVDPVTYLVRLQLLGSGTGTGVSAGAAKSCMLAMQDSLLAVLAAAGAATRTRTTAAIRGIVSLRHEIASDSDRIYILDQWRAWVALDTDSMSRSLRALLRKIDRIGGLGRNREYEMACATWIGFDPERRDCEEIDLRNKTPIIREARQALRDVWPEAFSATGMRPGQPDEITDLNSDD